MAREPKCRRVTILPRYAIFKPLGNSRRKLAEVILKIEELEALRLKDLLGMEQEECAASMRVSRPTFQRILMESRRKLAEALIEGKIIRIEGGDYCLGQEHCRKAQLMVKHACLYPPIEAQDGTLRRNPVNSKIIAVCADNDTDSALVDGRFGRCKYFLLWDEGLQLFQALRNSGSDQQQGAGTGAVQELLQRGVAILVCNRIGPNALTVFKGAGGSIFQAAQGMAISDVMKALQAGQLEPITEPNHNHSE